MGSDQNIINDYGENIEIDDPITTTTEYLNYVKEKTNDDKIFDKEYNNKEKFFYIKVWLRKLFRVFEYRVGMMHYNSYKDRYTYTEKISSNEGELLFKIFNSNIEQKKSHNENKKLSLTISKSIQKKLLKSLICAIRNDEYNLSMVDIYDIPYISKRTLLPVLGSFKYIRMIHISLESNKIFIYLDFKK